MFDFFFFFKQKTAYEMRISDWSSDVCSSDLPKATRQSRAGVNCSGLLRSARNDEEDQAVRQPNPSSSATTFPGVPTGSTLPSVKNASIVGRSEEHTSELQSLMRISYAVFCLKKKKPTKQQKQPQILCN